jgi:hypothetical protein
MNWPAIDTGVFDRNGMCSPSLWGLPTVYIVVGEFVTCPCCGELSNAVTTRRRNTAYNGSMEECNYLESCEVCMELDNEYNAERLAEYFNSR